ncbi:MAG TPA: hypothetical protein VHG51_09715, partial [Longimicrobiaceae bacterium]|nr:hypothetical protein [Longimicrobiaceae bacterium]
YLRGTRGLAVPDPTPTAVAVWTPTTPDSLPPPESQQRESWVAGEGRARGLELSLRKLTGRVTGSVGYTLSSSELRAAGFRYPAPWHRGHSLDATGLVHLLPSLRVGGAYTAASGARYTRFHDGVARCEAGRECRWVVFPTAGIPSGEQAPAYRSLDLLAEWSGRLRGWEVGVYAQLRNATGRGNPAAYVGHDLQSQEWCWPAAAEVACEPREHVVRGGRSHSLDGLRRLPLLGVRVAF